MAADADPAPEVLAAVRMHQVAVGRLARLVVASGRSSHAMVAAALAEGPTAVAVVGTAGPGLVLDLDCRQFQHLLVARMELVALVLGLARRLLASVCGLTPAVVAPVCGLALGLDALHLAQGSTVPTAVLVLLAEGAEGAEVVEREAAPEEV